MRSLIGLAAFILAGSALAEAPTPPVAAKKPYQVPSPNGAREDDYYWLRDDTRKNPEMLGYLKAENAYADAVLARTRPLEDQLYREYVGRIVQDDSTVPYLKHGYYYYTRFEKGADYPIVARKKGSLQAKEEVLLDEPALAKGHGFYAAASGVASPDNRLYAWMEDTVGRRQYVLRVKDLATGKVWDDGVTNIEGTIVWGADNKTLLVIGKDPTTLLGNKVLAHTLGTPASTDRLVYAEKDDTFYMDVSRTGDDRFVCIGVASTTMAEQRCAPVGNLSRFTVLVPRTKDILYQADHLGGRWIARSNWKAPNYRLTAIPDGKPSANWANWKDIVAPSATTFIENFKPMTGFLAIEERSGGNKHIRLMQWAGKSKPVTADEPAYAMSIDTNEEPASPWLRYTYTSLVTPKTTFEVNAATGERRILKTDAVPGYDKSQYVTERVWVTARDGVKVPVSLFYKKGFRKDGSAALYQTAYGSYGFSSDPALSIAAISMADRGMVYALAHIRGGQEMGRAWFDDGHLLKKKNSFTDFIDVTRALVAQGYAAKGRVAALGGSAGGLLMGAVANMAPQDYRVIVAQVPFVDVVTTMLDASIPLTTGEYDQWGNPAEKKYYDYILTYSPYDNVKAQAYPSLFVGTGLWDSQVQYYEPTKWVAKLRATKTDTNPLVFRVNMEAGHGGKSGRFQRWHSTAEYNAFALDQLGISN